ncbi:Flp family type IVb pilin [Parvibaculaceae bacterium PLY_AMNH_Bact1]|nr:Flp family type IVb pilin [Parvibaculaceae bacterium PLY_AMNH_Bact1]
MKISDTHPHGQSATVGRFLDDTSGATAIEYGLIASLIAVAIVGVVNTIGTDIFALLRSIDVS